MAEPSRRYSVHDKYRIVGRMLAAREGTLLDVGARDRALRAYIDPARIRYRSADNGPGHDLQLDLESPLPLPDRAFDFVVALDVLEHLERIHDAFRELSRIAGQGLVVALPNLASLSKRWSFLWRGHLATGKYDLLLEHQGDRHRWLTVYSQINRFVTASADRAGLVVEEAVEELEGWWPLTLAARWSVLQVLDLGGVLTTRCIFLLARGAPG